MTIYTYQQRDDGNFLAHNPDAQLEHHSREVIAPAEFYRRVKDGDKVQMIDPKTGELEKGVTIWQTDKSLKQLTDGDEQQANQLEGLIAMTETKPQTETAKGPDMVNHPAHYKAGGIECIDYLKAKLSPEQFIGFCIGNKIKYESRCNHKGKRAEDLKKANWYGLELERYMKDNNIE